jgi:Cdc6-like AAA superfamily ATPase
MRPSIYLPAQGYRATQAAIVEATEQAAEVDQMKGSTLEEISQMVDQISREYRSKQAQLQPLSQELKVRVRVRVCVLVCLCTQAACRLQKSFLLFGVYNQYPQGCARTVAESLWSIALFCCACRRCGRSSRTCHPRTRSAA